MRVPCQTVNSVQQFCTQIAGLTVRASQPGVEVECEDVTNSVDVTVDGTFITYSTICVFPDGNFVGKVGQGGILCRNSPPADV